MTVFEMIRFAFPGDHFGLSRRTEIKTTEKHDCCSSFVMNLSVKIGSDCSGKHIAKETFKYKNNNTLLTLDLDMSPICLKRKSAMNKSVLICAHCTTIEGKYNSKAQYDKRTGNI